MQSRVRISGSGVTTMTFREKTKDEKTKEVTTHGK